jgi:hypothetical protein
MRRATTTPGDTSRSRRLTFGTLTTSHVVASALGHSSPAVTLAHYIDGDTARRTRTRRVIGKVAPDPALRVVGDEPATAAIATRAPRRASRRASGNAADPALQAVGDEPATAVMPASRKPTRRGSGMAAKPALRVVHSDAASTAATGRAHQLDRLRGKRAMTKAFPKSRKGFRPFRRGDVRGEHFSCAKGDSNPHGVTH